VRTGRWSGRTCLPDVSFAADGGEWFFVALEDEIVEFTDGGAFLGVFGEGCDEFFAWKILSHDLGEDEAEFIDFFG